MSPRLAVQRRRSALARRTALAPACRGGLQLPSLTGLHIVPLLPKVLQDPRLGDATLENLERPIQTVTFFDLDLDHELLSSAADRYKAIDPENASGPPEESGDPDAGADEARSFKRAAAQRPILTTFSAAGPLAPWTMSNSTRSPSASVLKPLP